MSYADYKKTKIKNEADQQSASSTLSGYAQYKTQKATKNTLASNKVTPQQVLSPTGNALEDAYISNGLPSSNMLKSQQGYYQELLAKSNAKKQENQNKIDAINLLRNNEDYAKLSAYTPKDTYRNEDNLRYNYINNDEEAKRIQNENTFGKAQELGEYMSPYYQYTNLQYLNDDERSMYNYLYSTQGKDKAEDYIKLLDSELNKRMAQATNDQAKQNATDHPGLYSVESVVSSPFKGMGTLGMAIDYAKNGYFDENAWYNQQGQRNATIRSTVSQNLESNGKTQETDESIKQAYLENGMVAPEQINRGAVQSFLYQTGMSMADNVMNTLMTAGMGLASSDPRSKIGKAGEMLTLFMMSSGAAADSITQAKQSGLSDTRAWSQGLLAGAIEFLTEKMGWDALFDKTIAKESITAYIVKNMLSEGFEEASSDVLNLMVESVADVITQEQNNSLIQSILSYMEQGMDKKQAITQAVEDFGKEVALDFLGGALSGLGFAGSSTMASAVLGNVGIAADSRSGEGRDALVETGLSLGENTLANKLAQKNQGKDLNLLQALAQSKANKDALRREQVNATQLINSLTGTDVTNAQAREIINNPSAMDILGIETEGKNENKLRQEVKTKLKELASPNAKSLEVSQVNTQSQEKPSETAENSSIKMTAQDKLNYNRSQMEKTFKDQRADLESKLVKAFESNGKKVFNDMVQGVDNATDLYGGFLAYYNAGRNGTPLKNVKSSYGDKLTTIQQEQAYNSGIEDMKESLNRDYKEMKARISKAVVVNPYSEELRQRNPKLMEAVAKLVEKTGTNLEFTPEVSEGMRNGGYSSSQNKIFISYDTDNILFQVTKHEFSHRLQTLAPEQYNRLKRYILRTYGSDKLVDEYLKRFGQLEEERQTNEWSYSEAEDEIVAYFTDKIFNSEEEFLKVVNNDYKFAEKLHNALLDLIYDVKEALGIEATEVEKLQKIERLWAKALREGEKNNAIDNSVVGNDDQRYSVKPPISGKALTTFVENLSPEAKVTYDLFNNIHEYGSSHTIDLGNATPTDISTKYMRASEWNGLVKNNKEFGKVAKELVKLLPEDIRNSARFNANGTITETPMEKEFKVKQSFAQRVVDALPNKVVSSTYEIYGKTIELSDKSKVECVGGDAYRRALLEEVRRLYKSGDLKTLSISGMAKDSWGTLGWIRSNQKTGASGDFTTLCPQMYFNKGCWYCYRRAALTSGADNANVGMNVWYTGEILRISKEDIDMLNKDGGLRIQSFGDWFDYYNSQLADVIADAEQQGLQVKIITKEPSMIKAVAKLKEQGLGKNVYFNLSADFTIEKAGDKNMAFYQPLNPERPFMNKDGQTWWKRALTIEEANEYRQKYSWVNTRIVATNMAEFLYGLESPIVNVVTGYHGRARVYDRISSITGERLLEVEPLGDSGMPRFKIVDGEWAIEYEGKNAIQKKLAQEILARGLVSEYYKKACCITGRCDTCEGKCGRFSSDFKVKNATNRDASSVAYWQKNMQSAVSNKVLDEMDNADMRKSIKGEKATLSTNDKKNLKEAKTLDAQGINIEEIYSKTGWYKQSDGKWRTNLDLGKWELNPYGLKEVKKETLSKRLTEAEMSFKAGNITQEIYDFLTQSATEWSKQNISSGKLDSFLKAPKLFNAYPQLKNVSLWFEDLGDEIGGFSDVGTNSIHVNNKMIDNGMNMNLKKILFHEIQHMIQSYEGFAEGADPMVVGMDGYLKAGGEIEARDVEDRIFRPSYYNRNNMPTRFSTKDYGYHAGDLGKAESLAEQGYYRGTGHFGTGTYFVGNEELINGNTYGKRPHEKVDFSNYNLFKVKNSNDGYALHNFLKGVDGFYDMDSSDIRSEYEWDKKKSEVEDLWYGEEYDTESLIKDVINLYGKQTVAKEFIRLSNEPIATATDGTVGIINGNVWNEIPYESWGKYVDINELVGRLLSFSKMPKWVSSVESWDKMIPQASRILGVSQDKINSILSNINTEITNANYSYEDMGTADSAATRFMKALGYEGIDVRNTSLDNTEYGSVIYDLKGEDLARKKEIGTARFSTKDSEGRTLSKVQQDFFKDSKIRDENGNLLVVYHGTNENFTVFDRTKTRANMDIQGNFFTPYKLDAQGYGENVGAYYINITNPASESEGYKALNKFKGQNEAGIKARDYLISLGYDGVNNANEEFIAFDSSQIKLTSNTNPTTNEDVRYSTKDSAGRTLTKDQQDYFKDSKVRDYNGNLMVVYHGTNAEFDEFKNIDGGRGGLVVGFFTTDAEYAEDFGNVKEYYLNFKNPLYLEPTDTISQMREQLSNKGINDVIFNDWLQGIDENESFSENTPKDEMDYDTNRLLVADLFANGGNLAQKILELGYDGVEYDAIYDAQYVENGTNYAYIAFNSNDIKLTTNIKPTSNGNTKYSTKDTESILSKSDYARFYKQIGDIKRGEKFAKTSSGWYIIEVDNKLIFTNGDWNNPSIDSIIIFADNNESNMTVAKEVILYEAKNFGRYNDAKQTIEDVYGQGYVIRRDGKDYNQSQWEKRSGKRSISERDIRKIWEDDFATNPTRYSIKGEAKVDAQIQALRDKLKEQQDKYEKKLQDYKLKANQRYQDRVEKLNDRQLREKIAKHSKELSTRLLTPTDKKHIPEELRTTVASLLSVINQESTFDWRDGFENSQRRTEKGKGIATKRTEQFVKLRAAYERVLAQDNNLVIDPDLMNLIHKVEEYSEIPLGRMNHEQLLITWNTLKAVEASMYSANRLFKTERAETLQDLADRLFKENADKKERVQWNTNDARGFVLNWGERTVEIGMMNPLTALHRLGETGDEIFHALRKAQDEHIVMLDEISKDVQTMLEGFDRKSLDEVHKFKGIELTTGQIMSLYELSKRDQAKDHILKGGIRAGEVSSEGVKAISKSNPTLVGMEELGKMFKVLTEDQKKLADRIQKYLSTNLAELGNDASMEVYGYRKFTEKNYFPIKTDKNQVHRDSAKETGVTTIASKGIANAVIPYADNAVIIDDILDVLSQHATDMSYYGAWLGISEDLRRILNYRYRGENPGSVRGLIERVMGKNAPEYFNDLLDSINQASKSPKSYGFDSFIGNYKAAAVAGNIRVIVQQPTAILRALSELDSKYLTDAFKMKRNWEEVKEHSPIAIWKDWGNFEIGTGKQLKEIILGTDKPIEKFKEKTMQGASDADSFAWSILWNAVKLEIEDTTSYEVGSEDYWKAVTERFEDIVDKTQVVDGVLQRSGLMRSKHALDKMSSSFMAEPTKVYNMFTNAIYDYTQTKDGKKLGKVVYGVTASFIANAIVQSIIDAMRNDDKDKDYWEKFLVAFIGEYGWDENKSFTKNLTTNIESAMGSNLLSSFNIVGYIPYLKDVASIIQGYDVTRMDMDAIVDTVNACNYMVKALSGTGKMTISNATLNLLAQSSKLLGLPIANLKRDLVAGISTIASLTGSMVLEYTLMKALYNIKSDSTKTMYYDMVYKAYVSDKDAYRQIYRDMVRNGYKAENIDNAIKNRSKK